MVHAAHDGGQHRADGEMGKGACVCVCVASERRKECVREGKFARFLTQMGVCKGREEKCSLLCQRALTQKSEHYGGGAQQIGDLRLLEHGSKRGGALVSYVVVRKTV